ncbi:MAG: portal protein [Bacteroidales bacterium]|nr:portal protein [Bacteroidales bacterium]
MEQTLLAPSAKLERLKRERDGHQQAKINFNNQYAALSQYFYQIKQSFNPYTPQVVQGDFENDGAINDNIGSKCATAMASAIMGMVWKNEAGTFRFVPSKAVTLNEQSKAYFGRINADTAMFFERPKSRFVSSLFKTILESVIYGTSGMIVQSGGYANPLKFYNKSVLSFYIGYDKEGEINAIFIDYNISAQELYDKYGALAGSSVQQAISANNINQRFVVTEAIKPRRGAKAEKGKLAMPFSSDMFMPLENIYLEEGGYESLPLKVLFYDKLEYEAYGRGKGMEALPTVVQANICTEILAVGGELTAQPAMGMYDNGSLAGLAVDFSAGALNVFNVAGTIPTEKPIFPLFTVGDLRVMAEWLGVLKGEIKEYFLLDKLYDLNQQQRMTLGEAMIREAIRSDSLTPVFTQILAFLEDVLSRAVDIMFGMGLMGVKDPNDTNDPLVQALLSNGFEPFAIPKDVLTVQMSGLDWYDIEFINPASRIMNTEELQSTLKFIEIMGTLGGVSPDFIDVIDPDGTAEKLKELTATDTVVTRTMDERKRIRDARAEMQGQLAMLEAQLKQAQANQMNSQAAASQSNAVKSMSDSGGVM